ncbi:MAG: hypothetical protein ACOC6L_03460 [Thermodesulfobacteriota bacterium]
MTKLVPMNKTDKKINFGGGDNPQGPGSDIYLETRFTHIENSVNEIKTDIRELRRDIKGLKSWIVGTALALATLFFAVVGYHTMVMQSTNASLLRVC